MFQQGGQMNEEQKAFTAYLIKVLNPKDAADFENKVAQLSENELKEFYKQYKAMEGNQISMAKLGAKLSYVQTLRGECPEGYEVEKYMAGGCVKCKKKAEGAKVVDIFKDKCGGKAKKRVKKGQKGQQFTKNDTIHVHDQYKEQFQGGTHYKVREMENARNKTPYKKVQPGDPIYGDNLRRHAQKWFANEDAKKKNTKKSVKKNFFGGSIQRRIIKQ